MWLNLGASQGAGCCNPHLISIRGGSVRRQKSVRWKKALHVDFTCQGWRSYTCRNLSADEHSWYQTSCPFSSGMNPRTNLKSSLLEAKEKVQFSWLKHLIWKRWYITLHACSQSRERDLGRQDKTGSLTSPIQELGISRTCPAAWCLHGRLPPAAAPSAAARLAAR